MRCHPNLGRGLIWVWIAILMANGLMPSYSNFLFMFSLNEALKYSKTNDGPTNNLLAYMKKFDYVVPDTWKNYRPLTEK